MEIILAIVVASAVIFFGALISMGNERQRKAIDALREQTTLWAIQDLRLKREKLAREVKIDDALSWLNGVVARVYGDDLGLIILEILDNPQTLECVTKNKRKIVFSTMSPEEIRRGTGYRKSRLSQLTYHPLGIISHNTRYIEISILNGGILFDLELQAAWKLLMNKEFNGQKLFGYFIE
jgi:hypothetical protein